MQPLVNLPQRGAGEVASGVFMRLVSLWWEFPPRLNSNIRILRDGMQQFFVGFLKIFLDGADHLFKSATSAFRSTADYGKMKHFPGMHLSLLHLHARPF